MDSPVANRIRYMARRRNRKRRSRAVVSAPKQGNNSAQSTSKKEASLMRKVIRGVAGLGGGVLGLPGGPGAMVAGANSLYHAGDALATWMGFGDYNVSSNSLVGAMKTGQIRGMHSNDQRIIVRHKEYVTDLTSSSNAGAFKIQAYSLNPGLAASFPWLARIAGNFQEYRWKGVIFEFRSTSATAIASSTNSAMGSVMMATQYRSTAPAFVNKQQMLNEYFSSSGRPFDNFCHPVECNPKENPNNVLYVRSAGVPSGEDEKTYDLGEFYIASTGFQGTNCSYGELWCTYEVELLKPIVAPSTGMDTPYFHLWSSSAIANTAPWGNPWVVLRDTIGVSVSLVSLTIAASSGLSGFVVIVNWYASTTGANNTQTPSIGATSNCTLVGVLGTNAGSRLDTAADFTAGASGIWGSTSRISTTACFQVTDSAAPIQVTASGAVVGNTNAVDVFIFPLPSGVAADW